MSILLHGDCLDEMKGLDDNSVDLIFCDLPYGQTSCKWDCPIDLDKFWVEVMRIKKLNTPIFMTTTTKFGVSLINSAPKKCPFRWDIVWVKSACAGFLCAKKMPMRKHEMVYAFYEKLPFYDLSSHQHKFINHKENSGGASTTYGKQKRCVGGKTGEYKPPLPTSIVKEEIMNSELYGELPTTDSLAESIGMKKADKHKPQYDPPLPTSIVKEVIKVKEEATINNYKAKRIIYTDENGNKIKKGQSGKEQTKYDPPLPTSIVKEDCYDAMSRIKSGKLEDLRKKTGYEPPLPTSIVKEEGQMIYGENANWGKKNYTSKERASSVYDPPLPTSMLEIKSTRGKHSTEKPVALMEWILKYFSKEGDTVLDPTMGSGSTGVACKNMNRNFIGIEMDAEIYEVAVNRIE